jgi:hypothetical protein
MLKANVALAKASWASGSIPTEWQGFVCTARDVRVNCRVLSVGVWGAVIELSRHAELPQMVTLHVPKYGEVLPAEIVQKSGLHIELRLL